MNSSIADDRALEIAGKALQAGDKVFAQQILAKLIRSNPKLTSAWALMAQTVDLKAQKLDCWRRVLALDPNHSEALIALGLAVNSEPAVNPPSLFEADVDTPPTGENLSTEPPAPSHLGAMEATPDETAQVSAEKDFTERKTPRLTGQVARARISIATLPPRFGTVVLVLLGLLLVISLGMLVGGSVWFFSNLPRYQPLLAAGQTTTFASQMAFPFGLMVAGFIGTILTSLGLNNAIAGQQDAWRLNSSKSLVDARVVDAWIETPAETGASVTSYWIAYQFEIGLKRGGIERFTIKERISEAAFIRLDVGAVVPVRFLIENPRICRLNFKAI